MEPNYYIRYDGELLPHIEIVEEDTVIPDLSTQKLIDEQTEQADS